MVWEEIAGAAINADFAARVTTPLNRAGITAAITATATRFGLDATDTTAAINAVLAMFPPPHVNLLPVSVIAAFNTVRSNGILPANAMSAAVYVNSLMAGTPGTTPGTTPGMMVGLEALLAGMGVEVEGDGASRDASDFSLDGLNATMEDEGGDIESFSARVNDNFGGFGDDTFETMGLWGDGAAAFVVLSGQIGTATGFEVKTAHIGTPADPPTGRANGRAYWIGRFTGVHTAEPGPGFNPDNDADADAGVNAVMLNDSAMGDVRFDVTFDGDGDASTMDATFDNFAQGIPAESNMISGIPVGRRGSFSHTVPDVGAVTNDGTTIDGQFYEASDGENVAGNVMLTDDTVAGEYTITGVFVATE
jgi:hypothetical protein